MPPRISLTKTLGLFKPQTSSFSTTIPFLALRDAPRSTTSSSARFLDLDPSLSPKKRDSTGKAFGIYRLGRKHKNDEASRASIAERMAKSAESETLARQMPRRWRAGDVYAPHDLSPEEIGRHRRSRPTHDIIDTLGINPVDMYRNFSFIAEYTTSNARIKTRGFTGLRPVNQRKLAKAIRRAIGLGLHPSVHAHPELVSQTIARAEMYSKKRR